jgi:hypothetical protein
MRRGRLLAAFVVAAATIWAGQVSAAAHPNHSRPGGNDGIVNREAEVIDEGSHQHGGQGGHLPAGSFNVAQIGKLRVTNTPSTVSDVAYLDDTAYLGEWAGGRPSPECTGGYWAVDITNPGQSSLIRFRSSHIDTYVTEGLQALNVDTPFFSGDLLLISNETCGTRGVGGLTLWDVDDPLHPVKLSEGEGGDFTNNADGSISPVAHDSHSAFMWQDGENLYAIAIDNIDDNTGDLDFFDITDPSNPVLLSETGIAEWPDAEVNAFGDFPTSHDFDVRNIGGTWYAMVSYWDAGWVLLNVDDPANPVFIEDSEYLACDPVNPNACPPEGNGHQGEWDMDGDTFLGTDEDQSPFRLVSEILTGPNAGEFDAGEFGWTPSITEEPDLSMNGPTIFGSYGCPDERDSLLTADEAIAEYGITLEENEDLILVTERGPVQDPNHAQHGACFFSEKVETAQLLGYDGAIVANHHVGAGSGNFPDAFICGSQGHVFTPTIPGTCIGHRMMHLVFNRTPDYTVPYPVGDPGDLEPNLNELGEEVGFTALYDGWGYVRLLDANDPELTELDQMAVPSTNDPAFAEGFGDQSVHEVAIELLNPNQDHLAYFSWYDTGFWVGMFDDDSIEPVGWFQPNGGSDLWGVQLTDKVHGRGVGRRVVVASDRDFGLRIFKYTGSLSP